VQFDAVIEQFPQGALHTKHELGVLLKYPLGQLIKHDVPFRK
jgi:hypothetical protein